MRILRSVPEDRWNEIFLGKWSLADIVAHLIGWDFENTKSVQEMLEGKLPSCFANWDDNWVTYNDVLVARYKKGGKTDLLNALRDSRDLYIKELTYVSDELFDKDIGLRWKDFIITPAVNASYETEDEMTHLKQISDWLGA